MKRDKGRETSGTRAPARLGNKSKEISEERHPRAGHHQPDWETSALN